jgi:UDP-N-acetylmuramoylalanine--D-glutamate ligase
MIQAVKQDLHVIVGIGATGLSCLEFLQQQGYTHLAIMDSRENPPALSEIQKKFPQIPVHLGGFDAELLLQAKTVIVSPGVSLQEAALQKVIQAGIPVIGDIELFVHYAKAPIVAITGSNGKSTVTTMVGDMAKAAGLKVAVGGNLGTPALQLLAQDRELYVLELSSFQLETTYSLKAKAAVVLNISEDHMDRYASIKDYLAAKQRIYQNSSIAIVNRDAPECWQGRGIIPEQSQVISFGLSQPQKGEWGVRLQNNQEWIYFGEEKLLSRDELKIKGRHQLANALAAFALGNAIGLSFKTMVSALKNFEGLAHRCQWVRELDQVNWYNDSKATNVSAAQAAIEGLGATLTGQLVVIAGGMGKNADFTPLRKSLSQYVSHLVLLGQDAIPMAKALDGSTQIHLVPSLEGAITKARELATPGDAVILAPACASYDMFRNFEHRGEAFTAVVRALS